jgi:adenylyl-sulfate kinase
MWMTGLSGAGKTTVAARVGSELETRGFIVEYLDGDVVREHLSADLGFSRVDRNINVERIAWVASRVARAGAIVIVSAISPYSEARQQARAMVEKYAPFVEIYVSTPLEVCMHRDPKGLYRKAVAGEISRFTGISDPYEPPREPDIEIDTSRISPTEAAQLIREHLERLGTSVPGSKQPQVVAAP